MLSLKLEDGTLLKEPELNWNSILPTQIIKYMEYKIVNKRIRFIGYDRYLRLKEITRGINSTFQAMSKIILVGQCGDKCTKVTLDLIKNTCLKEDVSIYEVYNNRAIEDKYWKNGENLICPNVYIILD
jgi:hypothetical protein